MIWDKMAGLYDVGETIYNKDVFLNLGKRVAGYIDEDDVVLECACGTGAISYQVAQKCRLLAATDMSKGMLVEAEKKCGSLGNVVFRYCDIMNIKCRDNRFDKVIAGNVIHLLDDPVGAVNELLRVCKPGGRVIIPTYINAAKFSSRAAVDALRVAGVDFKSEFDLDSYKSFFEENGFENVSFEVIDGRMPCAIAVLEKEAAADENSAQEQQGG